MVAAARTQVADVSDLLPIVPHLVPRFECGPGSNPEMDLIIQYLHGEDLRMVHTQVLFTLAPVGRWMCVVWLKLRTTQSHEVTVLEKT